MVILLKKTVFHPPQQPGRTPAQQKKLGEESGSGECVHTTARWYCAARDKFIYANFLLERISFSYNEICGLLLILFSEFQHHFSIRIPIDAVQVVQFCLATFM